MKIVRRMIKWILIYFLIRSGLVMISPIIVNMSTPPDVGNCQHIDYVTLECLDEVE